MAADITVFDPESIIDKGIYKEPCRHPDGVIHVAVNGVLALKDGRVTGQRHGKVLQKN